MINLFNKIYLQHDNIATVGGNQKKFIVTDKTFDIPYSDTPAELEKIGILGIFKTLDDFAKAYEDMDGLWTFLRQSRDRICIVARKDFIAALLLRFYKSIFKTVNLEALYQLYLLNVNNENILFYHSTGEDVRAKKQNTNSSPIVPLSQAEFNAIATGVVGSDILGTLDKSSIPFEILMLEYFSGQQPEKTKKAFFTKVDRIVKTNVIGELIDIKDEFLSETNNYYLLNPDKKEFLIDDPVKYVGSLPVLAWTLDPSFISGNEDAIMKKYPWSLIREIFNAHEVLFEYNPYVVTALNYVLNEKYDDMIAYDIADQKGTFFNCSSYGNKINGLLISYSYQNVRMGLLSFFMAYLLK